MIPEIKFLNWDSNLFGYKIANLAPSEMTTAELSEVVSMLEMDKYSLAYCFVNPKDNISTKTLKINNLIAVDHKVVFFKRINQSYKDENFAEIISYDSDVPSNKIISLALQSGIYSRFYTDKIFINNEYQKLYQIWIEKSVRKEIAEKAFVYILNNEEAGLITLGMKANRGEIGLVAVDETVRQQSIGKKLVRHSVNYFRNKGIDELQVVTQYQNKAAVKLYESCGFIIESITDVYHLWIDR